MNTFFLNFDTAQFVEQILGPTLLVLFGFGGGFAIEKLIGWRTRRHGKLTPLNADHVLVAALRGMPLLWITCIGIYLAIDLAPLEQSTTFLLMRALQVPIILSLTLFAIRLAVGFIDFSSEGRGGSVAAVSLSRSLIITVGLGLGILMVLQSLNIPVTPFIAALGIGGLAVSLALEETLSNVFSGLYIILSKQTQPGDYVRMKVDENDYIEGYITDITWRSTKIRAMPSRMAVDIEPSIVVVPNSRMASDIVVIHHRVFSEHEILVEVSIAPVDDLEKVEQITLDIALEVLETLNGGVAGTLPLVRYRAFHPTSIDLMVVLYADETTDRNLLQHELIKRLYRRYQRESIAIISSHTPAPPRPADTKMPRSL